MSEKFASGILALKLSIRDIVIYAYVTTSRQKEQAMTICNHRYDKHHQSLSIRRGWKFDKLLSDPFIIMFVNKICFN